MIVFEIIAAIAIVVGVAVWIVVKLTRSLWTAAWQLLQSENKEAARLQRIQEEAEALRRRNAERNSASHRAAELELESCLQPADAGQDDTTETAAGRAEEPCQEKLVDHS